MSEDRVPLLRMEGISKSFPGVQALDQVDFEVYAGEVHALVGENGAGKSTLIKILSGAYAADAGRILFRGKEVEFHSPRDAIDAGIATINQELMLIPQLSVGENVFLGRLPRRELGRVDWAQVRERTRELFALLGLDVDPDALVGDLSVAEQQATEIARSLSWQAEIIVMDEPTSALSGQEIEHLLAVIRRLRDQGKAVVLITHKLDEVFQVADRITVLRDGHLINSMMAEETTPEDVINKMVGRSVESVFVKETAEIGTPVLEVRHLSRRGSFYDVSFTVRRGEVVGFAGVVGSGRTEVMRAIFGADPIDEGEIWVDGQRVDGVPLAGRIDAGLGLVPEDRKNDGLVLGMSVGDNLVLATLKQLSVMGVRNVARERQVATGLVTDIGIKTPSLRTEVLSLSGGNQQKVVIGKWLATGPKVLILDEPTRGIDIGAKAEVHALIQGLARQGVGILIVSSELIEVMSVSDRILVMHEGRITGEFDRDEATEEAIMACATGQISMMEEG